MSCCRCLCVLCLISILVIPYSIILVDCSPLIFRLILQSILFWSTLLAVLYAHTVRTITKRLETGLPDQRAKVLKVRKIPTTPHPQMEQKIFCWIQLLNGNNSDEETPTAVISPGNNHATAQKDAAQLPNNSQSSSSQAEADEKSLRDSEALLQDLREWAHVPCVLVSNDVNPKPGDVIQVCMIDGDLTRPIHVPFQMQMREKLKGFIVKKVRACLLALLGLYLLFGTIYMTSFDSFHESTLQAPVVRLFNSFFPDNNNQSSSSTTEDHWFCTITTGVSTSYDMLILIQITIPVGLFILFMIIKGKQGLGLEEPSPDSYQLLRDDDEFEGVTTGTAEEQGGSVQQPTAAPAAAATKTRVTPYGQYTAVSVTGS